jgi:hypothetical protein
MKFGRAVATAASLVGISLSFVTSKWDRGVFQTTQLWHLSELQVGGESVGKESQLCFQIKAVIPN